MSFSKRTTRRQLVQCAGLAAGALTVSQLPRFAAAQSSARPKPEEVLQRWMEGTGKVELEA